MDGFACRGVGIATEPFVSEAERDPLNYATGRQASLAPPRPERIVAGGAFQKVCDFVNVAQAEVAAEEMAHEMEG